MQSQPEERVSFNGDIFIQDEKFAKNEKYIEEVKKKYNDILNRFNFNNSLISNKEGVFLYFEEINSREELIAFLNNFFGGNSGNNIFYFKNFDNKLLDDILYDFEKYKNENRGVKLGDRIGILSDDKKKKIGYFKFKINGDIKTGFKDSSCYFMMPVKIYGPINPETKKADEIILQYFFDEFAAIAWKEGIYSQLNRHNIELALQSNIPCEFEIAKTKDMILGKDGYFENKIDLHEKPKPKENEDGTVDNRTILGLYTKVGAQDIIKIKYPKTDGVNGIDIKGNLLIPPEAKEPDIGTLLGKGVEIIKQDNGVELLVSAENGYAQIFPDGTYNIETFVLNKRIIGPETGDLPIDVDFMQQWGEIKKTYKLICRNCEVMEGDVMGGINSVNGNIVVNTNIIGGGGSIIAENGSIIANSRISNNAILGASNGQIRANSVLEYSHLYGKELYSRLSFGSCLIGEKVIVDEIKGGNICARIVKISKISKNPASKDQTTRITIGVKNYDFNTKKKIKLIEDEIVQKRKTLTTMKPRYDKNLEAQKAILQIDKELENCIINMIRIESNPNVILPEDTKKHFSEIEKKYKEEIEHYFQLQKIISGYLDYEKLVNELEDAKKQLLGIIGEYAIEIGEIEAGCELEIRLAFLFEKLDSKKYIGNDFSDLYRLSIVKSDSDLYNFCLVGDDGKIKTFSNSKISFEELYEFVEDNINVVNNSQNQETNNFVVFESENASNSPWQAREIIRKENRYSFSCLKDYPILGEFAKPIKVKIDDKYYGELIDLSLSGIGFKIYFDNSENNSDFSYEYFEKGKFNNLSFEYCTSTIIDGKKELIKINIKFKIEPKSIFVSKTGDFIRVGGKISEISTGDDGRLSQMLNAFYIEVIRNQKEGNISREFKFLSVYNK